ncbi:hypothetical protein BHE74_00040327, partial [Ensete ventricosum]
MNCAREICHRRTTLPRRQNPRREREREREQIYEALRTPNEPTAFDAVYVTVGFELIIPPVHFDGSDDGQVDQMNRKDSPPIFKRYRYSKDVVLKQ